MVMDTPVVISLVAVVLSGIGLLMSGRKDTRSSAESSAIVQTKLDSLINGVTDIRVELRTMRDTIGEHGERLAKVESLVSSNVHRLDALEAKRSGENTCA